MAKGGKRDWEEFSFGETVVLPAEDCAEATFDWIERLDG